MAPRQPYDWQKRWDLVSLQNVKSEEQARVPSGRLFHACAAATEMARLPRVAQHSHCWCAWSTSCPLGLHYLHDRAPVSSSRAFLVAILQFWTLEYAAWKYFLESTSWSFWHKPKTFVFQPSLLHYHLTSGCCSNVYCLVHSKNTGIMIIDWFCFTVDLVVIRGAWIWDRV